jgi:hypothetical protein
MRRRDGSSASEYDRLEVVDVAYGHMDDVRSHLPLVSPVPGSDKHDIRVQRVATCEDYPDDNEGTLCRAIFDFICYCGRKSFTCLHPSLADDAFVYIGGRYVENPE